jgi:hypothetical protein
VEGFLWDAVLLLLAQCALSACDMIDPCVSSWNRMVRQHTGHCSRTTMQQVGMSGKRSRACIGVAGSTQGGSGLYTDLCE